MELITWILHFFFFFWLFIGPRIEVNFFSRAKHNFFGTLRRKGSSHDHCGSLCSSNSEHRVRRLQGCVVIYIRKLGWSRVEVWAKDYI